jgi:hypothetical protein
LRAGNPRSNVIVEATIHVVAVFTTLTQEGRTFYKSVDRDRRGQSAVRRQRRAPEADRIRALQIRIDHHFEDTLIVLDNGEYAVDMTKFDAVVLDSATRDSVRP